MRMLLGFAAATGLVALGACNAPAPAKPAVDTAKIAAAIKADEAQWNADWKARDPDKIAGHYAADSVVMAPGIPPMHGTGEVVAGLKAGPLADKGMSLSFASEKIDVSASGDMAVSHGTYSETDTDPKTQKVVTTTGTFVTYYKPQADGSWKAIWDINTPQGPAKG